MAETGPGITGAERVVDIIITTTTSRDPMRHQLHTWPQGNSWCLACSLRTIRHLLPNRCHRVRRTHQASFSLLSSPFPTHPSSFFPLLLFSVGRLLIEFSSQMTMERVQKENPNVTEGGRYKQPDCRPRWKVAIIIPFRHRENHLKYWLHYLHPILRRQKIDYGIYIINQLGEDTFNRAKLLNVGYTEALKDAEYDCFIFSDVDLIPMDDRNLYHCYDQPRHFAIAMDKFGFRLPYAGYFGGVSGLSKKQFLKINGFPNEYWGWGGEDDDIYNRITLNGMKVSRPDVRIGRYRMIKHERDKHNEPNPQRFNKIQNTKNTMKKDGISSLTYKLVQVKKYPMYTNISVEIGKPPPRPIKG
ncbi:beta-1,4-galactosyltransferase 2 isoform X2 [Girardinichthys multiradiatus]|uniref:beta-1,4-galactosyltransferase 2 isoform X2 n=1 Tax=Girardinichthys multiradiatus TaxID=208333 RepID=UPI001FAB9E96|nr:beta-1,4-galactosyltransferase 2 isoform X2 [Girardinichthys multiradiatus]